MNWYNLTELIDELKEMQKDPKNFFVNDEEIKTILENNVSFTSEQIEQAYFPKVTTYTG